LSGKQRKTGSDRLQERAQALIERGLTSYRRGEVEAAVIDWRHALALDPHAERAREYIEHALAHKEFDGDTTEEPGERTADTIDVPSPDSPDDSIDDSPEHDPGTGRAAAKPPLPTTKPHVPDTLPDTGRAAARDAGRDAGRETARDSRPEVRPATANPGRETARDSRPEVRPATANPGRETARDSRPEVRPAAANPGRDPARDSRPEVHPATANSGRDPARDSGPEVRPAAASKPVLDRSLGLAPTSPALPRVLRKTFEGPPMPAERLAAHFAGQSDGAATEKMNPDDIAGPVQPLEPMDTQPLSMPRGAELADTLLPMPMEGLSDALSAGMSQAPPEALIEEMPTEDTEPLNRPPPGLVQDEPPVSLAPTVEIPRAELDRASPDVPEKANIRTLARTQLDALETYEIHLAPPDAAERLDRSKRAALPPVVIEDVEEDETPEPKSLATRDLARSRTQTAQLYGGVRRMPSRPPSALADAVSKVAVPPAGAAPGRPRMPEPPPAPRVEDEPEPPEVTIVPDEPEAASARGAQSSRGPADEDAGPTDPVARMLLERLDAEKPARRGDDESYRERVLWLFEYAQSEYIGGDYQTAVIALDLALDQAPDSDAVQSLIEERTHSLIEIYASYEGDPSAVPSLAMTPNEYGQRALDSRAAFLLSRVDGMLTIDDLMTVSGMPVLEAHRHLCNLLRQGILTLR
jgi:hypothetical protein